MSASPWNKLIRDMGNLGIRAFGVWAALNVLVIALCVQLWPGQVGELTMSAVLVLDAIIVALTRPHWPEWLHDPPPPPRYDDED